MTRRRFAPVCALLCALVAALTLTAVASATADSSPSFAVSATVRLRPEAGAVLVQTGTYSGAPLGRGRVVVRTRLGGFDSATVHFVMTNHGGSLRGSGRVTVTFKGSVVSYAGAAQIVGGTGDYARVHASHLQVRGSGEIAGGKFTVSVTGS